MLKRLIELLPVSRRRYEEALAEITKTFEENTKVLDNIATVLKGFNEAEANHCQIEMSIMQQLQKDKMFKTKPSCPITTKKIDKDVSIQ